MKQTLKAIGEFILVLAVFVAFYVALLIGYSLGLPM